MSGDVGGGVRDDFLTLAGRGMAETRVKGSTFIALAAPARGEEEARSALALVAREHHAATHNCSAWLLRDGVRRTNDDGEPSGSAGAPILAAIEGAGLSDCVVVVTRYYGGTKLGVGGLVRAYGEVAAAALAEAPRLRGIVAARLRVRYPYEHTSAVMRLLERGGTSEVEHGYSRGGSEGEVEFSIPIAGVEDLREQLRDASGGALTAELLERRILYESPRVEPA